MRKDKNKYQKVNIDTLIDERPGMGVRYIRHAAGRVNFGTLLVALVISALILVYSTMPVFAASNYIEVTGDPVNVRSKAGLSYSVIGKAHKGDQYICLGEKKDASGQKWYYVQFSDSKTGWIHAGYAKTLASASATAVVPANTSSQKVEITGATVNIRTGNNTTYAKVGVAKKGEKYGYLGSAKASNGVVWYKIQFSANRTGWVTSKYSKLTAPTTTTTKTTTTAKTTAKTTTAATATTTVPKTTATTTKSSAATVPQYIRVTSTAANVRSGAGASYAKLGTATQGSVYKYLGSGKAANGVVWYKIQYTSSKVGWLISSYAQIVNVPTANSSASPAQKAVNAAAEKYGAVGVQVAVIKNGKVTDTYNYGYATNGSDVMKDSSKIRIASISKVVVGMTAMKMQEEGIVDLDENIGTYWGTTPYKKTTLRKLLTHTSYLKDNAYVNTKQGTVNQLKSSAYYCSSNAWMYNNYGIGVAGSTLEVASGRTLNSYADEKFFAPLAIDACFTSGDLKDTSKLATLYYPSDNVARSIASAKTFKSKSPGQNTAHFAGGLTISARGMAKLTAVLANDGVYDGTRYLSAESVKTMETQYCSGYARGRSFKQCIPLRYQTNIYGQNKLYYHLGTAYGTLSFMGYNPDTKNGVVVISTGASDSYDRYGTFNICADIANYFLNQ